MNTAKLITCLLVVLSLAGCNRKGGVSGSASTNLSIVVWSPFPPTTNSYRHVEHLQQLQQDANALIATNPAIFGQSQARGSLAENSPLRGLLGIPAGEPAYLTWWQSMDQRCVIVRSSQTEQRFGQIKVNLRTGLIDSAHDVKALFVTSEDVLSSRNSVGRCALVGYATDENLFSAVGLSHPGYRFGGLRLEPAWTNLNTQGFLLDAEGLPYPREP